MKKSLKFAMIMVLASFFVAALAVSADAKKGGNNNAQHRKIYNEAIVTSTPTVDGGTKTIPVTIIKNTSYTIDATNAKIVRRYNATAEFSEIMQNDKLKIWGTLSADGKTITATKIRDNSIQKLGASFHGIITDITYIGTGTTDPTYPYQHFSLHTRNRGDQIVKVTNNTVVKKYRGVAKTITDLQNSYDVTVKGIWNRANNVIYGVSWIKIRKLGSTS